MNQTARCRIPDTKIMIVVQITKDFNSIDVNLPRLKKLVKAVCNRFKVSAATVSIAIVDNARIRRLNKRFLNCNRPTDCLSFDLSDDENRRLLELAVNAEMAVRQAKLRGHSAEAELALYITHGLLHNFGFDDTEKTQAEEMHRTENEILQQFGYGSVYNS